MTYNFEDQGNKPIVDNIESMTLENKHYHTTIWTDLNIQVTLMTIQSGDNIGLEIHHGIEQGKGFAKWVQQKTI